jgi:hypothetical protein
MGKLIVYGFEDWAPSLDGGLQPNGSRILIEELEARRSSIEERLRAITNGRIDTLELRILPAKFLGDSDKSIVQIKKAVLGVIGEGIGPDDFCIGFGQGGLHSKPFVIESQFSNLYVEPRTNEIPLEFKFIKRNKIVGMGVEVVSQLISEMERNPELQGMLDVGTNAGNYNCNFAGRLMFELMQNRSLFVHVPFCVDEEHAKGVFDRNKGRPVAENCTSYDQLPTVRKDLVEEFVITVTRVMAGT